MTEILLTAEHPGSLPLWFADRVGIAALVEQAAPPVASWIRAQPFSREAPALAIPYADGSVGGAGRGTRCAALSWRVKIWHAAGLSDRLPAQTYHVATELQPAAATHFVLGWLMGAYRMTRYRSVVPTAARAVLVAPPGADLRMRKPPPQVAHSRAI